MKRHIASITRGILATTVLLISVATAAAQGREVTVTIDNQTGGTVRIFCKMPNEPRTYLADLPTGSQANADVETGDYLACWQNGQRIRLMYVTRSEHVVLPGAVTPPVTPGTSTPPTTPSAPTTPQTTGGPSVPQFLPVQVTFKNMTHKRINAYCKFPGQQRSTLGVLEPFKEVSLPLYTSVICEFEETSNGNPVKTVTITADTSRVEVGTADPAAAIPRRSPQRVIDDFLQELNSLRAQAGLPGATYHAAMSELVSKHCFYMAEQGRLSHDLALERSQAIDDLLKQEGHEIDRPNRVGGEVCHDLTFEDATVGAAFLTSQTGFMSSPGHKTILMTPGKVIIGVAGVRKNEHTYITACVAPVK